MLDHFPVGRVQIEDLIRLAQLNRHQDSPLHTKSPNRRVFIPPKHFRRDLDTCSREASRSLYISHQSSGFDFYIICTVHCQYYEGRIIPNGREAHKEYKLDGFVTVSP